ncbi:MAG: hypothetical protein ACRBDL_05000 [Alphaproteobacteria bacterium]
MPYLIFLFGILASLYALYRFFLKANPDQIKKLFRTAIILCYGIIMLYFALIGRMIISLTLLILFIPFVISHYREKLRDQKQKSSEKENDNTE